MPVQRRRVSNRIGQRRPVVKGGVIVVRAYEALEASVARGILFGLGRADKYSDGAPTREQISEHVQREVMTAISEDFSFGEDDSR